MGIVRRSDFLTASGLWVALAAVAASGCTPTCKTTCGKLLSCELDDSPRTAESECEGACANEEALYTAWDDQDKMDALDAERKCVSSSTCDEIAAGACYDEALFVF